MTQAWSEFSSGTTNTRLSACGNCAISLSDGTPVWIAYDPATNLKLQYSADGVTVTTIATLASFALSNSWGVSLCRDASDNLYVMAADTTTTSSLRAQCFAKGTGLSWTAKTALVPSISASALGSVAATWCNTAGTGGAGLIFIHGTLTAGGLWWATLDAGALLAGSGTALVASGTPTFSNGLAAGGNGIDISADSFGALSGVAGGANSNTYTVGRWGINAAGTALTSNTNLATGQSTANTISRWRLIRYGPSLWVLVTNSSVSLHWAARAVTPSAVGAAVDCGTPTNLPLVSNTINGGIGVWDAYNDPNVANRAWLIVSPNSSGQIYRVSIDMTSGTPVWGTAAVLEDTIAAPFSITNAGMRAVAQSSNTAVDYQFFVEPISANFALYGNWSGTRGALVSSSFQGRRGFKEPLKGRRGRGVLTSF